MNNFNKIEDYLDEKMSEAEVRLFEIQITQDEDLAKEVAMQRFERDVIQLASEDDLRDRIKNIQKASPERVTTTPSLKVASRKRWLLPFSIAASVLLLVGFFFQKNQYSNVNLVNSYYSYDIGALRNTANSSSVFSLGTTEYDKGNYTAAIQAFESLTSDPTHAIKANYLIGHSYFQLQNHQKASDYFKIVFSDKEKAAIYYQDAQWYWLLSELAQGNEGKEFHEVLNQLISQGAGYTGAKALKEDLNGFWR